MTNEEIRCFIYASITSADNDKYTEEAKQEVMTRYKQPGERDWDYILEPIGLDRQKYVELLTGLDKHETN